MAKKERSEVKFVDPPAKLPFELEDDEKYVCELRPVKSAFIIRNSVASFLAAVLLSIIVGYFFISIYPIAVVIIIVVSFILALAPSLISYNMYRYWLTSDRVIGSRGFVAYSIDSIPIEIISDVILNRGITDILLGVSTLYIVPIGGGANVTAKPNGEVGQLSSINYLGSLDQDKAEDVQKWIFDLRTIRKKELK